MYLVQLFTKLGTQAPGFRFSSTVDKGPAPNAFDKRLLVYFKKYKTIDEIPATVSRDTLHKVRGKARIYVATLIMVTTLVSCYGMARSGKRAAERGEGVSKQNLEWHKQIKEGSAK